MFLQFQLMCRLLGGYILWEQNINDKTRLGDFFNTPRFGDFWFCVTFGGNGHVLGIDTFGSTHYIVK